MKKCELMQGIKEIAIMMVVAVAVVMIRTMIWMPQIFG